MQGAFILGSARCGSTLVSEILRSHPAILSLSEVFSMAGPAAFPAGRISAGRFWRGLARPTRLGSTIGNPKVAPQEFLYGRQPNPQHDPFFCPPILAIALPHLSTDPDALFDRLAETALAAPRQTAPDHYRNLFETLAHMQGKRLWVERSGGSLAATATLAAAFPDSRHVFLTRSGVETTLSMADYPATRMAVWMWKRLAPLGLDLLDPQSHYGRGRIWRLLQPLCGLAPLGRILAQKPDLCDVAGFWSAMTLRALPALRALPKTDFHHLSYEALIAEPGPQVAALGQFLAGEAPLDWLTTATALPKSRPPRSATLDPALRNRLRDACAPAESAIAEFLATRS
ncbi:hypothetical protein [Paracoccus aminophilus]|uniref:Sulfotransferase n=1 Tax=Paracoccus aminophilus JCM 7686 TaxID=1367847 RepID=S5XLY6_PARAH|nr:hypothetical protein [Paracoccus aminophilus]AGT08279.1 hypothetical protein JCM7686_1170 [Paracoccus aminophilus JCM 7686]